MRPTHTENHTTPLYPIRAYLDMDLTLTPEQTECLSQQIASHVVSTATQLRHFFLVEDLVDSLKVPPKLLLDSQLSPLCPWWGWGSSLFVFLTLSLAHSWLFSSTS